MKIAIVHSFYSRSSPSGENIVVDGQVEALRKAGHTVELISKETDDEISARLYGLRAAFAAAGVAGASPDDDLRAFNPDVVHVHNMFPNWGGDWMTAWAPRLVTTLHNYRSICANALLWRDGGDCTECLDRGSFSAVRHRCYRDSAVATTPLAWATRSKGKHSPILNYSSVLVALNRRSQSVFQNLRPGMDVRMIPNFASDAPDVRSSDPTGSFIYVGRLTEEKGVRWLLRHWPKNRTLQIIGDGPLAPDVIDAASSFPATFTYAGRRSAAETRLALSAASGLVIPSLWAEGIPTVALEALAAGTPVLISSKCAAATDLTDGNAGVVFSTDGDAAEFELAIGQVESSPKMRSCAGQLYDDRYSEQAWVAKIENVYQEVVRRCDLAATEGPGVGARGDRAPGAIYEDGSQPARRPVRSRSRKDEPCRDI